MKKIILTLCSFTFLFNLTPAFADTIDDLKKIKTSMLTSETSEEQRNYLAGYMFQMYFSDDKKVCNENGIFEFTSDSKNQTEELIKMYNLFTKDDINTACFFKLRGKFIDTTDECILQRRNGPAAACWYDYKKFLPDSSKIKTDDEFITFSKAAIFFGKTEYCKNAPELTTQERKECEGKVKKYITQLSKKTAPHCRDIIPQKYNEFLQNSKDLLTLVNNTEIKNFAGQKQQVETFMFQSIYGNAYEKLAIQELQELGFKNFCTVEGFEKDIKKLPAKEPLKRNSGHIIDLN